MNDKVVPEPKKARGRPSKTGKPMSNNERQKRRQGLTNGVFDAVVSRLAHVNQSERHSSLYDDFKRDHFFYDGNENPISISYSQILRFIPENLREDFIDRIRIETVKNYYKCDINILKEKKEEILKDRVARNRFGRLALTAVVYSYYKDAYYYQRPIFETLKATSNFLDNYEKFSEKEYVEIYIKYRNLVRKNERNTPQWAKALAPNASKSEKSNKTRLDNIRDDFITKYTNIILEENNIYNLYPETFEKILLKEEAFAHVWSMNPDELKSEYKIFIGKIENKVIHKKDIVANEAPVRHEPEKVEKTPAPDVPVIQPPADVVDSSDKVVPETRPVRRPRFQRRPPKHVTEQKEQEKPVEPAPERDAFGELNVEPDFSDFVNDENKEKPVRSPVFKRVPGHLKEKK